MLLAAALVEELEVAIATHRQGRQVKPEDAHRCVRSLYTWQNVAKRTENVYDRISHEEDFDFADRLKR